MEFWRYFHQSTLRLLSLMDSLCEVSPKYCKDKSQRRITSNRTKAVIISHMIGIILYIFQSVRMQALTINAAFGIASNALVCAYAILSCRYHPKLLAVFYNIFMATLGPNLMNMGVNGIHRGWAGVQTYPILVLLVTGSLWHFLLQAIFQLVFVNTIYQSAMVNSVAILSPEDFTRSISGALNGLGFINIVSVTCIQIFLQNAYKKISIVEQRNVEVERQKTFLLGFSHELRNLINSLMGNVRLASMENLSERAKDFLRNADVCGELLLHLINNILDTGKVEVNDLEINPMPTDIYNTIERTWSICAELIRRKNLQGSLKIQNNLPKAIKIDHYRLTQIFLNIVGNAVKFTDRGSIDITVEWIDGIEEVKDEHFEPHPYDECDMSEGTFEKNQRLSVLSDNFILLSLTSTKINSSLLKYKRNSSQGILRVSVNDSGCGIQKEDVETLFQRYSQVTSDISKRKLGTGLGLFITKELCRRMNGKIRVYSKQDKGSCFIFCLPVYSLIEESEFLLSREISEKPFHNRKLNALIVDDDQICRQILANFMHKLHYEVLDSAANGQEAIDKYMSHTCKKQKNPIHIITMDLTMPVMDGKKSAERIREYEAAKGLEPCILIVISGNCGDSEIEECTNPKGKIRANAFLKKPATIEDLSRIITLNIQRNSSLNVLSKT